MAALTAEALIRQRLLADAGLAGRLARYAGVPAVFYASPPDDTDLNWEGMEQYPHIEFSVDWRNEPEYDTGGMVNLDIVCADTSPALPEEVAAHVKEELSGVFFAPADAHVFILQWGSTQAYNMGAMARQEPMVYGLTLEFRLIAFPERESIDPDPVMALNRYITDWDPKTILVRKLKAWQAYKPTNDKPVVYFRTMNKTTDVRTNTVTWIESDIAMHLYAPDIHARQMWLEAFTQKLAFDAEVTLLDGSPMFIRTIKGSATADELSGQLTIAVRYGLLRRFPYAHPLMHSYWNNGEPGAIEEHAEPN